MGPNLGQRFAARAPNMAPPEYDKSLSLETLNATVVVPGRIQLLLCGWATPVAVA